MLRNIDFLHTEILIFSLASGQWQQVFTTYHQLFNIAWSPDSQHLIYRSLANQLVKLNIHTKQQTQITELLEDIIYPQSNSRGDLVAVTGRTKQYDIIKLANVFNSKKINNQPIIETLDTEEYAIISPNNQQIALHQIALVTSKFGCCERVGSLSSSVISPLIW